MSSLPSPIEALAQALEASISRHTRKIDESIKARIADGAFDFSWTIPWRVQNSKDPVLVKLLEIYAPYKARTASYCQGKCMRECECPENNTLLFSW